MEGLTEEGVLQRLKELQKEKGYTENGLAGGDTNRQKRLNRQLSHGAVITLDTILSILDNYPDVSADWLLRGNGEMYLRILSAKRWGISTAAP